MIGRSVRGVAVASSIVVVTSLVAGCGSSSGGSSAGGGSGGAGKPIDVLAIEALSGPLASSGQDQLTGAKAAVSRINAAGGVLGRQLKLDVRDDAGDPTKAVSLLHDALDSGAKPDILVDGTTTAESLAMAPLVKQDHILASSASTGLATPPLTGTEDVAGHPTKFTTSVSLKSLSQAMVGYLTGKQYKKIAVLAANDAYGQSWSASYIQAIKAAGMTVSASASFDPTVLDVTPQLQKLQASDPDVLIAEAYGAATGYVLKSREKLGWTSTPMVGAVTFSVTDLTKVTDPASFANVELQAVRIQKYVPPSDRDAKLQAFISAVEAQGGMTSALSSYSFPYDAMYLAVDGIRKAGTTDALSVAKAMETLGDDPNTVIQPDYYTPQNHYPSSDPNAFTFVAPGPLVDGMIKS